MAFQIVPRCHWVIWLSAAMVVVSLTSAKTITLGAASTDNDELKTDAVNARKDNDSEERVLIFPKGSEPSLTLFKHHVTAFEAKHDHKLQLLNLLNALKEKHKNNWSMASEAASEAVYDEFLAILTWQYGDTRVRQLLNDPKYGLASEHDGHKFLARAQLEYWEKRGVNDHGIMQKMLLPDSDGNNMLTDLRLLHTWISYASRVYDDDPYDNLLFLLARELDFDHLAIYLVNASKQTIDTELQEAASVALDHIYKHYYDRGLDLNGLSSELEVNKKRKNVLLWGGYKDFLKRKGINLAKRKRVSD